MTIKPNAFVENLAPYVTTSQEPWVLKNRKAIHKLDWNEGAGLNKVILDAALRFVHAEEMLSWYPDCNTFELTDALSSFLNVSVLNILTFPGSDVALETLFRTFLAADDKVVVLTPTYEHVFVYIASMGAEVLKYPLEKPFHFNIDALTAFLKQHSVKALYLVRPNNPCGYLIPAESILSLCADFPDMMIVVDEAYIEFAGVASLVSSVNQYHNLFVLRTFSKAFSLAGLRIGYVVANHQSLQYLSRLRNGKNISMLGQLLAIESLKHANQLHQYVDEVIAARYWLCAKFNEYQIVFYPSFGNFVLFEVPNPKQVVADLKLQAVYVRDRSTIIANCVRVTIINQASTEYFWAQLQQILAAE